MSNCRRSRLSRRPRSSSARTRIDYLEPRLLLDAGARPSFAQFQGHIPTSSAVDSIPVQIGATDFAPAGRKVLLSFTLQSTGSSSFRPGAIQLETSSKKKMVHALVSQTGTAGSGESFLIATLSPGTFTILVHAKHGTFGEFQLNVSLAGDLNGAGQVNQADLSQIKADSGAKRGQARYLPAADVNNSGKVDKTDLTLAKQNLGVSTSIRPLSITAALDPSSAPDAQGVVHQASVAVDGLTEPGALVSLSAAGSGVSPLTTTAGSTGAFQFAFDVPLGTTVAQIAAHDSFGQQASNALTIVRANLVNQPPSITILSPASGLLSNSNITVAGQVTDPQPAVATLEVALDGGAFAAIPFAASTGDFQYTTNLPLDGSSDGLHTIQFRAANLAGNVATAQETFTLATIAPSITVTSPAEGAQVSTSPTVVGTVSDAESGVASLKASLDAGAFVTVAVGAAGAFSFATGLATDGSADGPHTVILEATDGAGNVAATEVDFTLNTSALRPPTITIQSPAPGLSTNIDPAIDGTVTGTDITSLQAQVDNLAPASVPFDASSGAFTFTPSLALDGSADGPHTVHFTATNASGDSPLTNFNEPTKS